MSTTATVPGTATTTPALPTAPSPTPATIPTTQPAAVIHTHGHLTLDPSFPVPLPSQLLPGQCLVRITHSGVCHTDIHAIQGDWPLAPVLPLVPGHEGVGEVVALAEGAGVGEKGVKVGDRVGVNFMADSCLACEYCRKGLEQLCPSIKLSGYTIHGTFSTYVLAYTSHLHPIPAALPSPAAAPILCAGVTALKSLRQTGAQAGEWVAIPGAGGGVGHLVVQYAKVMGLRVVAVDTGAEKEELVKKLGADAWVDYAQAGEGLVAAVQAATSGEGPHAAVITAGHASGYAQAVGYLRKGGTMVCVGTPTCELGASVFLVVAKQITVKGCNMGNRQDTAEALEVAARGGVRPVVTVRKLEELESVIEDMESGKIAGRVVLAMA
ncbi:hypothetical protein IAT38_002599 [Cryptococcus sp. DSM 104549]